ncbi:nascent polypeptide-associated complex protein [Methanococcus aeolicus]|uniref:Nascent polypeptide-associated complex protein n=1 Tax=Methanococcus aeolicus (strain ATCC BAA-1280 / DSM 17508 / OCM 812 / Nankai-3) TaxID=419665 RepID=NAC_META3|nr:nascent polypeptide-associated complex protein [Methanococcus aeolicus]A6UVF4.1 RecName: Full=Nascent polypeptide-associated complex protein [Methanococcus aeolicus Nankai-3]ABR56476.1 alpha-NAC related protein [Methanococcus aeolicus Nankai-3]UXM84481.1 nascent polypeptide-associated complex protein [Methanococcus aeolicus]
MFPGRMNPKMMRQMQKMMSDMGMDSKDIKVLKITMELEDKIMVFEKPKVQVMDVMGNKTYTITGRAKNIKKDDIKAEQKEQIKDEEVKLDITKEDIEMVVNQCEVSEEEAKKVLEECNGDIAEAILKLSQ